MVLTETSSVTSASTASSSSSANSSATTTEKRHFRFEANKVKGFRNKWREIWSPALQKCLVALAKDTDNNVVPLLGLLIETIQVIAYAFTNINWGKAANDFGTGIRFLQFEVIVYTLAQMDEMAKHGWTKPMNSTQQAIMYTMVVLVVGMMFTMIGVMSMVYSSFVSNMFTAGVTPMKVMRFLISLLTGVLYIPLLQVLISALRIGQPGFVVLGLLGLVVGVPFCFMVRLTYFQPNPMAKSAFARLSPNLEMYELFFRTALVFIDVFLDTTPEVRTLVMLFGGLLLNFYVSRHFPYYNSWMNLLRFNCFSAISYSGLVGTIAYFRRRELTARSRQSGDEFAIAYFVVFPFVLFLASAIFNRLYLRKTRRLYNKYSKMASATTTMQAFVELLANEKFKDPYDVELSTRFVRDTRRKKESENIELTEEYRYDKLSVKIAAAAYAVALKQFAKKPKMYIFAGFFHGAYRQDLTEWRMTLERADALKPGFFSSVMLRQSAAERDQAQRKHKNGTDMDAVDMMEIKNALKMGKKRCGRVRKYTMELWKMLLTRKVDPSRVQRLISKIYASERAARELYEATLVKYSESVSVAAAYATFAEEIARDYKEADELWSYASAVTLKLKQMQEERQKALIEASDTSTSTINGLTGEQPSQAQAAVRASQKSMADSQSVASKHAPVEKQSMHSVVDAASIAGSEMSGMSGGHRSAFSMSSSVVSRRPRPIPAREQRKWMEYRRMVGALRSNAIPRAERVVNFSFVIFFLAPLIQMIWILQMDSQILASINDIILSNMRREDSVEFPLKLTLMRQLIEQNKTKNMPMLKSIMPHGHRFGRYAPLEDRPSMIVPMEYIYLRKQVRDSTKKFEDIQNELFARADPTSAKFYTWIEPWIPLKLYFGEGKSIAPSKKPVFTASSEFWRHMGNVLDQNKLLEFYRDGECDTDPDYRYVMDNMAYAFAEAFDELTSMYTTQNTAKIYELLNIAWTILGVTIGIVGIIGIFFIRPSVNKVFREVDLSTAALMGVPKTAIENSYGTIRLVMNIQDKKKRAKKAEKAVEKEIRQSQSDVASVHSATSEKTAEDDKSSQAGSDASGGDDDDDSDSENEMDFMEDNEATTSSTAKLFIRYTARYVFALFLIVSIFTTVTAITYVNCLELIQNGIRADLGMRIAYKALRLGYTARLLVIDDKATYPDINLVHKKLKKDLKIYTKIQQALLYGDHDFGLEFAELHPQLKEVMYDPTWLEGTESLNGMENTVKGNVMNILAETTFPIMSDHPDYIALSRRIPLMYEAYHHAAEIEDEILAEETHYVSTISGIMFGAIVASLLMIYFFIFKPLLADLRVEHEKSKRLLYQIPLEAVKINFPLQILLRGEDAARDMFTKDEIPGVTFTKDGMPVPVDSIVNLAYVRKVVWESTEDLVLKAKMIFNKILRKKTDEDEDEDDKNERIVKKSETAGSLQNVRENAVIDDNASDAGSEATNDGSKVGSLVDVGVPVRTTEQMVVEARMERRRSVAFASEDDETKQ